MRLPGGARTRILLTICLLGTAYAAISIAFVEHYVSDTVTDIIKLALTIAMCVVGFFLGKEHFRSTNTTPFFVAAMVLLIALHVTELTEEFAAFQSVPLLGRSTLPKRSFEMISMIGSVALLLAGNFLSISEINKARKQAESSLQRLQERERRYRDLFEATNDAIFIMQGDQIVHCNSKTLEIFGCTQEQIIGRTPQRFSPPTQPDGQSSREKAIRKLDKARAGQPQSFEWRHIQHDGTPFDAEISLNLVELSDGPHIQAIVRDITERKQAQKALQDSEERHRTLVETMAQGVVHQDADGRIVSANPAAERILGLSRDQMLGRVSRDPRWRAIREDGSEFPGDLHPAMVALRSGKPVTNVIMGVFNPQSDEYRWISVNAVPQFKTGQDTSLQVYTTFSDITERKRAAEALQESESKLREAQEMAQLGHWFWDVKTGHVEWSDEVYRIFQLSPRQFTPPIDSILALSPWPEDHQRDKELIQRAIASREQGSYEQRFLRPDGSTAYYASTFQGVYDSNGDLIAMKGTVQDITERKRAEQDRLDYQRKLRSLALELSLAEERERRRIAAGLHDHACQTLVLAKMKLQELPEPLPPRDADEIARICSTLDGTLQSVRELVFDLSSPTLYKFGLEAALEELLKDKLKTQHGIRCTFHDDGAPKPLPEDVRILLFQSVRELLVNIIKYAQAREVTLDIARSNGAVRITVTDDGTGFDAEDVLAAPSRSRGFGLFNIAERLDYVGGSLDIYSQPGQGSQFTLTARLETQKADAW